METEFFFKEMHQLIPEYQILDICSGWQLSSVTDRVTSGTIAIISGYPDNQETEAAESILAGPFDRL